MTSPNALITGTDVIWGMASASFLRREMLLSPFRRPPQVELIGGMQAGVPSGPAGRVLFDLANRESAFTPA